MKRRITLLVALVLMSGVALAQDTEPNETELSGRELRKQKREERKAINEVQKEEGKELLKNRDFVLQAERIGSKWSFSQFVANQINFIKIDGEDIVIQFGSLANGRGNNGLGGITYKGKIESVKERDGRKGKAHRAHIRFHTPLLLDVTTIDLSIRGNQAHAIMWNNGKVTHFDGFYYSNEESTIAESDIQDIFR